MRERENWSSLPNKEHLARLPDLPKPYPQRYQELTKAIVVIPLFSTHRDPTAIEDWLVRSALWARRSWLKFTDVADYNVAVKFYVEIESGERIIPILDANGKPDIMLFHGAKFESDLKSNTGNKKVAVYADERFKIYDWVLIADADLFVASPDRNKMSFFQRLFERSPSFGALRTSKPGDNGENTIKSNWLDAIDNKETVQEKKEEWIRRAKYVLTPWQLDGYLYPGADYKTCHNGLTTFPAKEYQSHYRECCEWLVYATGLLASDQCTLSMLDTKGHKVFDISDELNLDFVLDWRVNELPDVPYFFHFNNYDAENLWRSDLGIECK